MRLQLALDTLTIEESRSLLDDLYDLIDIIEVGTPFIFRESVRVVSDMARAYPGLTVLADLKIMDAGAYEAGIAFEAGADIVTVLGVAHDVTIQGAVHQARTRGKQVMADLMAVEDVVRRAVELEAMGVDYVCVHTATDMQPQGRDPLEDLRRVPPALRRAGIAVAGGITPGIMPDVVPCKPDIVIVGGFITRHDAPRRAAQALRAYFV